MDLVFLEELIDGGAADVEASGDDIGGQFFGDVEIEEDFAGWGLEFGSSWHSEGKGGAEW